jgi:excisionase family DNA binding protein
VVLGINPFFDDYYCFHNYKYQPIGILSVLATLRAAGYEVAFLDAVTKRRQQTRKPKELENTDGGYYRYGLGDKAFQRALMKYTDPQVILMTSSMTFRWHSVRDCIALTKEVFPDVPVVLGGIYATLAYEHALKHSGADFVIQSPDGERKALSLVNKLTGNQRRIPEPVLPPCGGEPEGGLPFWAFDLLPPEKRNFAMLLTSYGCTRNCAHCASSLLYGGYKRRDVDEVIVEIDDRYNRHAVREFHLYDDDLLEDSQHHFELWAKEAAKRFPKARFYVPNALLIDQLTLRNAELLRGLKVKPVVLGVDAVHEAELLGRWWISYRAIKDTVSLLELAGFKRYDIKIYVHVSHPTQTLKSLLETIRFLLELGVRPALNRFTPIPGTRLFEHQDTDLSLLNNKIYPGVASGSEAITRKDFGKLKAFIDAIHFLQKGGLDLINETDELTESARSILLPKQKEYLTTTQVAQYLGIDASTVRRHIKQGKLIPAKRVGNRAYFDKSQIEKELPF